jgi:hypothetical protein
MRVEEDFKITKTHVIIYWTYIIMFIPFGVLRFRKKINEMPLETFDEIMKSFDNRYKVLNDKSI